MMILGPLLALWLATPLTEYPGDDAPQVIMEAYLDRGCTWMPVSEVYECSDATRLADGTKAPPARASAEWMRTHCVPLTNGPGHQAPSLYEDPAGNIRLRTHPPIHITGILQCTDGTVRQAGSGLNFKDVHTPLPPMPQVLKVDTPYVGDPIHPGSGYGRVTSPPKVNTPTSGYDRE